MAEQETTARAMIAKATHIDPTRRDFEVRGMAQRYTVIRELNIVGGWHDRAEAIAMAFPGLVFEKVSQNYRRPTARIPEGKQKGDEECRWKRKVEVALSTRSHRVTFPSLTWHSRSHPSLSSRWNKLNYWPICLENTRKIRKIFLQLKNTIANFALPHPRQSVEILPGEIAGWVTESTPTYPFLFAEVNLGVPQKVLYKAYLVAVRAYFGLRNETRKSAPSPQQSNRLDRLTRVVLLANPAHQTALNSRKRLVQSHAVDPHWELTLSASLLSCRECAKESILWHHRRWLLNVIHEVHPTADADSIPEIIPPDALEAEFVCASAACHIYPRNYHAWAHRGFCIKALVASQHSGTPSNSSVLAKEYQRTLKWIESHISDYSAMNYATNLEKMLLGGNMTEPCVPTKEHATLLLRLYPDHESLWMYLRSSVTPEGEVELITPMKEAPSVRRFILRYTIWWKISVSSPLHLRINSLK